VSDLKCAQTQQKPKPQQIEHVKQPDSVTVAPKTRSSYNFTEEQDIC